jgi:hypothetical protein
MAWMADPDPPRLPLVIRPSEVEIAAGIDGEIAGGCEFACGEVDGQSFGDPAEVEKKRPMQRNRPRRLVEADIAEAHAGGWLHEWCEHLAASMLAIEAALLQRGSDRRIECAITRFGHAQREADRFEEEIADHQPLADACRESPQLAVGIEARTNALDLVEPRERSIHQRLAVGRVCFRLDDVDRDDSAHRRRGAEVRSRHFAFFRALTTA